MKKFFKDIIRKFKKIWNKDPKDIIIPGVSLLAFIIVLILVGIVRALIVLVLINVIYFIGKIIVKKEKGMSKNQKKRRRKKRFKIFLLMMLTLFILGITAVIAFFSYIVANAPEFKEELLYVTEPSVLLDKDGNEIVKLGTENRIILTYDELPEILIDAIVATEDSRFFEHGGVDWARFLKASFYQLLGKSDAGGASTLTMQVSKNTHTSTEASGIEGIIRKFTDVYISMFKIEKNYTKERIMEFYVNSPYLGRNAYGVEQVSLTYFGKSTKELNLAEAAMIAGLFQAPGRYDPYKYPEATETRRQTVLKLMLRHGYISEDEYNIAKEMTVEKIVIPQEESIYSNGQVSPYQQYVDTVVEEVKDKTGLNPYTTSMTIYTTMDRSFQDYINGIMSGETYDWENDAARAGIAVINVKDGSVSALGGNRDNSRIDNWNYATDEINQIGSTAKPIYDYGPAIEYMNWSSYQILVDEPITYSDGTKINNWNRKFEGFETMRIALKGSRNIPALKAFKQNNKKNIVEFATNVGLTPEIYSCNDGYYLEGKYCINKENPDDVIDANRANTLHEAHAIGGYTGETPLTMAAAYASFANAGTYTEPYTFTKLIFEDSGEEFINEVNKTKAMSEETAYIISDMLATTATHAVGRYYNINGIRYAAKTGTTKYDDDTMKKYKMPSNAVNDMWTVGFNTEYAIGVWYGYDGISNEHYNILSGSQHNRMFNTVGKKVFTNKAYFTKPSGVIEVELESECPEPTLPSEFTPEDLRIKELFIKGTEPTTVSTRFSKLSDVSNLKGTVKDNKVTLTWDSVETPKINTESYLKEYYSIVFETDEYLNSFVSSRLSYNNSYIGNIGYNVYLKDSEGNLQLLDYVSSNKYETTIDIAGEYTFVVKTAYSIYKTNMSDGKSVKVNVTSNSVIIPDPENPPTDTDKEENIDKEENTDKPTNIPTTNG